LRSVQVATLAVVVGCSTLTACSSGSKTVDPATTTTTTTTTTTAPGGGPTTTVGAATALTPPQIASLRKYLEGEGAPLVEFARKTKPLSGPDLPTRAVCLDLKDNVLPKISSGPVALQALTKKVIDPGLAKLFDDNIFWLNALADACSRASRPALEQGPLSVLYGRWASLAALLRLYGFTV
jgi:hypothetical protein